MNGTEVVVLHPRDGERVAREGFAVFGTCPADAPLLFGFLTDNRDRKYPGHLVRAVDERWFMHFRELPVDATSGEIEIREGNLDGPRFGNPFWVEFVAKASRGLTITYPDNNTSHSVGAFVAYGTVGSPDVEATFATLSGSGLQQLQGWTYTDTQSGWWAAQFGVDDSGSYALDVYADQGGHGTKTGLGFS